MNQTAITELTQLIQSTQKKINYVGSLPNVYQGIEGHRFNMGWFAFRHEFEEDAVSLQQILKSNETISEPLAKYIAKICIKGLHEIKSRAGV